eukprot:Gb_11009 [translate_table: standard]
MCDGFPPFFSFSSSFASSETHFPLASLAAVRAEAMATSMDMDEVKKRWIRCLLWQHVVGTVLWIVWDFSTTLITSSLGWMTFAKGMLPSLWGFFRFLLFQIALLMMFFGHSIVTSAEEKPAASVLEMMLGVARFLITAAIGGGGSVRRGATGSLRRRAQTAGDWILFVFISTFAGFLSLFSVTGGLVYTEWVNPLNMGLRGSALGFVYGVYHIYKRRWVLSFPIIQRPLFFSLKMGIPSAVKGALKLSTIAIPCAISLIFSLQGGLHSKGRENQFVMQQIVFFLGAFAISFCWELIHHLIQVVHTRRSVFAPPQGSAAAETNPTEPLLVALEESSHRSLAQYLAYLDLLMVSENNVDSWRRAAFFEETGETYRRIISVCLRPLEQLVIRLSEGLDGSSVDKTTDVLSQQMRSPTDYSLHGNIKDVFNDSQLCSWCARIVASLTASSHDEDRFGVAQLSGCNGAVVSTLLSCLLIVEVYLGKRSTMQPLHLMGPASIKWTVPSRSTIMDTGKRQGLPFKKKTALHKKAYAMADVLRTAIYQITCVFQDEMLLGGPSTSGLSVAERDWLSKTKPLYGTHDMLLQKLSLFLEFRAS